MKSILVASIICLVATVTAIHLGVENFDIDELAKEYTEIFPFKNRLTTYSYKNCGNKDDIANLSTIVFSPDPLSFPGDLNVAFKVDIKSDVIDGIKGVVVLKVRVAGVWVKVPCVGNIGSCTYDDICQMLEPITECPPPFISAGVPCKCPFRAGSYVFPEFKFIVGAAVFVPGDYSVIANLTHAGKQGACAELTFSID